MTVGRNLTLFILLTSGGFVYICHAIPQVRSEPVVAQMTIGDSPEELQAAGKRIFMSDGAQCLTCHSLKEDPKARCPNQENLGARASQSRPGMSAAQYLVESVYNPNAFVVPGYPKNQMQPVNRPPIALSHDEILAVLVYLNSLGGQADAAFVERVKKAQDPWRKGLLKPEEAVGGYTLRVYRGDAGRGRVVLDEQQCLKCHKIGGEGRDVCPDLTSIGASQTPQYILESIVDSNAVIVKGYKKTFVNWKNTSRNAIYGQPAQWIPDKEHPQKLRLFVDVGGEQVEKVIDLAEVASLGDTIVGVQPEDSDEDVVDYYGEYLSGDEKTGVILRLFQGDGWVEKRFPPEGIDFVNYPTSPMPDDFVKKLTPRQIYDLVACLVAQKGKE